MKRSRSERAIGLTLALIGAGVGVGVAPELAVAQELTLSLGRSSSDYREFKDPTVLGAGLVVPVWGWLGVRLDYRRHRDDQSWETSTCQSLIPPDSPGCQLDNFSSRFTFQTAAVGPQATMPLGDWLHVYGALMWSRAWLDGVWTGAETGTDFGRAPDGTFNAWTVVGGATVSVRERWALTLASRRERPDFTLCIQDTYYPFCYGKPFRTVEFGITLRR